MPTHSTEIGPKCFLFMAKSRIFYFLLFKENSKFNTKYFLFLQHFRSPLAYKSRPERTRSSQVRWKSTGSDRGGRGQSPVPKTSDRSCIPDKARTPIRRRTLERKTNLGKGKSHAHQVRRRLFRIVWCWNRLLLHHQEKLWSKIRWLFWANNIQTNTSETILPRLRAPDGVQFPERMVPEHQGRRRHVTWRMKLPLLRIWDGPSHGCKRRRRRESHPSSTDSTAVGRKKRLQRNPGPLA